MQHDLVDLIEEALPEQVTVLRGQMASAIMLDGVDVEDDGERLPPQIAQMLMQHRGRSYFSYGESWGDEFGAESAELFEDDEE